MFLRYTHVVRLMSSPAFGSTAKTEQTVQNSRVVFFSGFYGQFAGILLCDMHTGIE